jgi:hypothetical protein
MPDQPPPEKIPTLEQIEKEWGFDVMSMFHSMVSPNNPHERGDEEES